MDANGFDTLTKTIALPASRRSVVGALLAAAAGRLGMGESTARPRQQDHEDVTGEGPCGNGSARANSCKRNRQCCTGFCRKRKGGKGRCRCRALGQSCREDRNCCGNVGQPMICQDKTCQLECTSNAQCGDGQVCVGNTCQDCTLTSQCTAGQVCLGTPARCVGGEACASNAECDAIDPLLFCENGVCQLSTECTVDAECEAGEFCLLGECVKPCNSEADCQDGPIFENCISGLCIVVAMFSDRAMKTNIASVDPADMLQRVRELPITTWNYTSDDPAIRHIGPMAQDFVATFGVGGDDRRIHPVDGQGVALAAIQGLAVEIERLRQENAALAARLAALEP
jgi:hypothetical protein